MLYPVESAVASVREETERVAEKILSEQVKDHQSSQSIREQWMQDTSKVVKSLSPGTSPISDFIGRCQASRNV